MHFRRFSFYALALSTLGILPACSSSDDDGGGSSNLGTVDVLIHDAPVDDLLSFSGEIRSVRLRRQGGNFTSDLLNSGDVRVEFLGLTDKSALLVRNRVSEDIYDAVEIGFTPNSYEARAESGIPVTVTALENTFLAPLPTLLNVVREDYARVDVDLNLLAAVSGNVAGGSVSFAPQGLASFDDGSTPLRLSPIKVRVTEIDELAQLLTVEAFADDAQSVSLGEWFVRTHSTQLFLDVDGTTPDTALFYDELLAGQTLLEVHGTLGPDGEIVATRLDIEDHSGGAGSSDLVAIEGTIVGLDASSFDLRVNDIDDGAPVAGPIIAGLPNSSVIDVSFDGGTVFILGETIVSDSTALSVGRSVEVRFCTFGTPPFAACVVDVSDQEPALGGVVTDVSGAPFSVLMRLDAQDPAVLAGLVQSDQTDVEVDLATSQIVFDSVGDPVLLPADLAIGTRVEMRGALGGTALAPSLSANQVRVPGGFLTGASMSTLDQTNSLFTTTADGTLVDPFGANVTAGSQTVRLQPGATYTGAATTSADLFTLLNGSQGATTQINVRGLGTANPNEIRAFDVHTTTPTP